MPESKQSNVMAAFEIDWGNPERIDRDTLREFIRAQYRAGKTRRRGWERRAAEQMAWVEGDQSLYWDDPELAQADVVEMLADLPLEMREPIEVNMMGPQVQQRIAFLIEQGVILAAEPQSSDDEDVAAARLQSKLLRYAWTRSERPVSGDLLWALWLTMTTGVSWLRPYWALDAGHPDVHELQDETEAAARARLAKELDVKPELIDIREIEGRRVLIVPPGDALWEVVSGFEVTEPEGSAVCDADWIICSKFRSMEWLLTHYPQAGAGGLEIRPTRYAEGEEYSEFYRAIHDRARRGKSGDTSASETPCEQVLVHELWRRRTARAPAGCFAVVCQEHLLHAGPNPHKHGRIPLIQVSELPTRRFRPPCTMGAVKKIQRARNRIRSMWQGHVRSTTTPTLVYPENCGMTRAQDGSIPEHVPLAQDFRPDDIGYIARPEVGVDIPALDELFRRDAQDVGGVHDATLGRREHSQESGRHAAVLQRSDQRRNSVARQRITEAIAEAAGQTLWLYWQYATEDRTIVLTGRDYEREAVQYRRNDMIPHRRGQVPGPHDFNVRVVILSDADTRMERIQLLTQLGFLQPGNPQHRAEVLRLIDEDVPPEERDLAGHHRRNARDEHVMWLEGRSRWKDVRAAIGDDDDVHIAEHMLWTTRGEYRRAVRANPELAEEVETHIREHQVSRARKAMQPIAIEERLKGELRAQLERDAARAQPQGPQQGAGQPGQAAGGNGAPPPRDVDPARVMGVG